MSKGMMPWPTAKYKAKQRTKLKYRKQRRNKLVRRLERSGKRSAVMNGAERIA